MNNDNSAPQPPEGGVLERSTNLILKKNSDKTVNGFQLSTIDGVLDIPTFRDSFKSSNSKSSNSFF